MRFRVEASGSRHLGFKGKLASGLRLCVCSKGSTLTTRFPRLDRSCGMCVCVGVLQNGHLFKVDAEALPVADSLVADVIRDVQTPSRLLGLAFE